FFQAEDGIRDFHVTGVQTCALPIWLEITEEVLSNYTPGQWRAFAVKDDERQGAIEAVVKQFDDSVKQLEKRFDNKVEKLQRGDRSEERRVGKEGRSRWRPDHEIEQG